MPAVGNLTDDNGDEIPGSFYPAAGVWWPNDPADTVGTKVTVLIGGNMQLEDVEAEEALKTQLAEALNRARDAERALEASAREVERLRSELDERPKAP